MQPWTSTRPNSRRHPLDQYEAEMADRGDQELDPHPNFLIAPLGSLLLWAIVAGAVWGLWAVARWVIE